MRKLKLLWIVAACVLLPAGAFATELVYNGDFNLFNESLELEGWTHTSNVEASNGHLGVDPVPNDDNYNDDWMALMAPEGFSSALLNQTIDTTGYYQATISFDYNLSSFDPELYDGESGPDYLAFFSIGFGTSVFDLFTIGIDALVGTEETIGWHSYSQTFYDLPGGDLFIGFGLANGGLLDVFLPVIPGDSGALTTAYLDNVSVDASPVPEPSTFMLLGSGLLGICFMARRSARLRRGKMGVW